MPTQQSIVREAQDVLGQLVAPGLEDPYPLYAWLREHAPVVYSERHDAYLLSRFADCSLAFRSPHLFRSEEQDTLMELIPQAVEPQPYRLLFGSLNDAPLPYTPLRRMIGQLLTPDTVRYIRDGMRRMSEVVMNAVAAADDGRPVDLHQAISVPIAERALSTLVGVPAEEHVHATGLLRRLIQATETPPTEAGLAAAGAAYRQLADYVGDLLDDNRRSPKRNLASMLRSSRLSDDEVRTTLITLWGAGVEKATITIDTATLAILRQPELVEWLRDEEISSAFVDELYRWDGPGQISTSPREALEDIEFGGHVVPAGAGVRMLLGSANRDPEAFPEPDRLVPSRIGPDPLLSGAGYQPCLGTGLARLQLCVLLPNLVERFPEMQLAGAPVWRRALPLREPSSVPVRLGVTARSGVPVGIGAP